MIDVLISEKYVRYIYLYQHLLVFKKKNCTLKNTENTETAEVQFLCRNFFLSFKTIIFLWKGYQESLIEANYISINIYIQLYRYLYNEKI